MASQNNDLIEQMRQYKDSIIENEGKNSFFKKSQKNNCAKQLSEKFDLNTMIANTVYIIPGTNKFIFDYRVFKLYAHDAVFDNIINYILQIYEILLSQYPNFETHLILDSFTISAEERYKNAIIQFTNKCMSQNSNYSNLLTKLYIYYTPSVFDAISKLLKPFVDASILTKLVLYTKADSPQLLQNLLHQK